VPQVFQPMLDVGQTIFNQRLHVPTCRGAAVVAAEQRFHVLERETDRLSGPDELQLVERFVAVQTIVARAAILRFDESDPFVVPHRSRGDFGRPRQLTDCVTVVCHDVVTLKPTGRSRWALRAIEEKIENSLDLTLRCNLDNRDRSSSRQEGCRENRFGRATFTKDQLSMSTDTATEKRTQCPSCGRKARRVGPVTLQALLKEEYSIGLIGGKTACCASDGNGETGCQPIAGDTGWRFCDSPDCDVVYFSEEGSTQFTKPQLKVAVGMKETTGERPLCYCFGHSVASIKDDLQATGRSDALPDIREKMKDPGCRCETENPSGSCCLGSVAKGIEIARNELGMTDADSQEAASTAKSPTGRGEKIATAGTLVSAIMASSCCWLPLVLLAVGVSGAGIAATLEAYRPLFMTVTFGFLGAAFYFTYRPKKSAAEGGHDCCATEVTDAEDCCSQAPGKRFGMRSLNKAMLWVVTVMAVAFLLFPSYVGLLLGSGDPASVTETMNRAVLKIDGMTCAGCSVTVAKAIQSVPGVLAVQVSYEKREAIIGTEICCPIPKKRILAALKKAGYGATFVSVESADKALSPSSSSSSGTSASQTQPVGSSASGVSGSKLSTCTLAVSGMT